MDVFKPVELAGISDLATIVEKFNRDQDGADSLFAEVVLYRSGEKVARLVEATTFNAAPDGSLVFEVVGEADDD